MRDEDTFADARDTWIRGPPAFPRRPEDRGGLRAHTHSVMASRFLVAPLLVCLPISAVAACEATSARDSFDVDAGAPPPSGELPVQVGPPADAGPDADGGFASCASVSSTAQREPLPVDIVWIVDNSSSMQPAVAEVQAGLNAFAGLIENKGLDYKVIMLSLRGTSPVQSGNSFRYPVCIPPPLGGANCGNSARFFHAALDVQSTQPLEQILGTLGQTQGYTPGQSRGGEAWAQELRPNATKSIVVVTDDNSRFPGVSFEMFPGGDNPNTGGLVLPPGILHPSRGDAWKGYVMSGIYGWGSDLDPSIRCTYPGGAKPPSSGYEYSAIIQKTGGVRAQLCAGSSAWGPFFDGVAQAVLANARVACELAIPAGDGGAVDPEKVNVRVDDGTTAPVLVSRVSDLAACAGAEGWYYDVPSAPTKLFLCPASCDAAQSKDPTTGAPPKVDVLFGCASVVR